MTKRKPIAGCRAPSRRLATWAWLGIVTCLPARAGQISVRLEGLPAPLERAVLARLEAAQLAGQDVSLDEARRLVERAESQTRSALEPYGYYDVQVAARLEEVGPDAVAVIAVTPGAPVIVSLVDVRVGGEAAEQPLVQGAIRSFAPPEGAPLDHAAYEKAKSTIEGALLASGYLDARLVTHRVDVRREARSAEIRLLWESGPRYRLGSTTFEGGQLDDETLCRFVPWQDGDFYAEEQLMRLQQRLVDLDYFEVAQVQTEPGEASGGDVPVTVMLGPAKQTILTGGLFTGTDTGLGVRGAVDRRWVNDRGHKLRLESIVAQRLQTLALLYRIPVPDVESRSYNFGVNVRHELTDTSESRTLKAAADQSREWRRWTRTLGLKLLTGDFEVAEQQGRSTLLYPEASLARKEVDDERFPLRGYSLGVAARAGARGLISDTTFVQATAEGKWIRGIGRHDRVILRGTAGATEVGEFEELPPELRFFAGGDRSIRGHAYQSIGPEDAAGRVVGGEMLAVASAEYEHYFGERWGIAAFVDAGDAFTGSPVLDMGAGIGARWLSPVGMVRLDVGVPVADERHDGVAFHVAIGPDL